MQPRPGAGSAVQLQLAVERVHPIRKAAEAGPACRIGAADAVVPDWACA
jgi:hypothetical protein